MNITKQTHFLHFSFDDFTFESFKAEIMSKFSLNSTYSILVKIGTLQNHTFKMCGPQIGLVIQNEHDENFYKYLYNVILLRINICTDKYEYMEEINIIEIMCIPLTTPKALSLQNINDLSLNKQISSVKQTKKAFNLLPLTNDENYFGFNIIGTALNPYLDIIKYNKGQFSNNDKLFIYTDTNKKYKYIIVSSKLEISDSYLRVLYDYHTGIFISSVKDVKNNQYPNSFDRSIGNVTLTIQDNKVLQYRIKNDLTAIQPKHKPIYDRNVLFGTFDLETFIDDSNQARVYALGFFTNLDDKPKVYYLTDYPNITAEALILKCIDDMLTYRYHNYLFYAHNLGHYDIVFIYNVLLQFNLNIGSDYYILNSTMRENIIIKLEIRIKKVSASKDTQRYIKISFVDSLNLLNLSLSKLTQIFEVSVQKGYFPHRFVTAYNLNYIGPKPDLDYFDNIPITEYAKINAED